VIDNLLCKCEALSSSHCSKREKEGGREGGRGREGRKREEGRGGEGGEERRGKARREMSQL
jgi:hypothetical protein